MSHGQRAPGAVTLRLSDEIPLDHLPPVAHWSENYCYHAYDFTSRVGYYAHIGRWAQDPTLWQERLYVQLPDGSALMHAAVGAGDCSRGPAGPNMSLTCEEAGLRWRIAFKGAMRLVTPGEMLAGPLAETVSHKVDMSVDFVQLAPVMMYPETDNQTYGRWHYEQMGTSSGTIGYGGRVLHMVGHGYRDHTRGPRHLPDLTGEIWVQGRFPSGLGFSVFRVWERRGDREVMVLDESVLIDGDGFVRAQAIDAPRLRSVGALNEELKLVLETPNGVLDMRGMPLATMAFSFDSQFQFIHAVAPTVMPFTVFEQPALLRCGSQDVEIHIERAYRHAPIPTVPA